MPVRKPTPILLQQLASRQEHMSRALEHLEDAIASVRKGQPRSDVLVERLEALRAQLQRHVEDADEPS